MLRILKNLIVKNALAKLICLFLAVSLWGWVKIQQTAERQFDASVEYQNLPEEFVVTDESDREVSVVLSGPKSTLNRITEQDVQIEIDAGPFEAGENLVRILPWNLEYPRGLDIESIQPPRLNVVLEERKRKEVKIEPRISEGPPEGFEYRMNVDPDTAVIYGSANNLEEIDEVQLQPVDLSGRDTSFLQHGVRAELPQAVQIEYPEDERFTLEFEIYEPIEQRLIENVPVTVLNVPPGFEPEVEPLDLDLKIKGPKRRLLGLSPEQIRAEVRAPEAREEPVIRQARIRLPEPFELTSGQQDRLTVRVRLMETQ